MELKDILTIIAIILGPIIAVQLTRYLDEQREKRKRKLDVFKTLMGTRNYTTNWEHVQALNRIDLEFDTNNRKEKQVIDAWKAYLDLLNDRNMPLEQWAVKRIDLLIDMLFEMASVLDYNFDKTHIKNSSYSPQSHGDINAQHETMRKGLLDILDGTKSIPVKLVDPNISEETEEESSEIIVSANRPHS